MIFVWSLALSGLILLFLEFFLPGAVMTIGGSILLMASLYTYYMSEGSVSIWLYLIVLLTALFFIARMALKRKKTQNAAIRLEKVEMQSLLYPKELVGKVGLATTDLKPSGFILIDDRPFEARSKSGHIQKGAPVKVLEGEGPHLIVETTAVADLKSQSS